jgi:hypothetical protein
MRKHGRPAIEGDRVFMAVRLPRSIIDAIDAVAQDLGSSRHAVAAALIRKALPVEEPIDWASIQRHKAA